jgi:hypothetical protein
LATDASLEELEDGVYVGWRRSRPTKGDVNDPPTDFDHRAIAQIVCRLEDRPSRIHQRVGRNKHRLIEIHVELPVLEFKNILGAPRQNVQVSQSASDGAAAAAQHDYMVRRVRGMIYDLD